MAESVKSTRAYNSPRRQEQAAATRRLILDAAQRLFEEQGFGATTMAAIAKEAGVALKTVYIAFDTKSGLLRALWHLRLRGDEEGVPVAGREWYRAVLEEPDPVRALQLNARNARAVKSRVSSIGEAVRAAATTDPDAAALWDRINTDFYENQRVVVEALHKRRALKRGLGVDRAADILWTLNHPDVWRLLVHVRGWTPAEWEKWFADISCAQLLRR